MAVLVQQRQLMPLRAPAEKKPPLPVKPCQAQQQMQARASFVQAKIPLKNNRQKAHQHRGCQQSKQQKSKHENHRLLPEACPVRVICMRLVRKT